LVDPESRSDLAPNATLYEGLASFRYALRQFLAFSEAATHEAGVTAQQYQALLVIQAHPKCAVLVKDLADQMLLQHNGAVQLIDRLVDGGLAKRRQSPTDARGVEVSLTVRGTQILAELAANHLTELLKHKPLLAMALERLSRLTSQH
jgi:DNA-binding MarR family transcriptional regulator